MSKRMFLSALREDKNIAKTTTIELIESDKVCQASAIIAIEPVFTPAQYFKANNKIFTTTEIPAAQ